VSPLNVGNLDRLLRLTLGFVLIVLAAFGRVGAWGWVGLLPLVTGTVAWCALYRMVGIATTSR
jgi:hypothetical protein